jgi:hypothetical protein
MSARSSRPTRYQDDGYATRPPDLGAKPAAEALLGGDDLGGFHVLAGGVGELGDAGAVVDGGDAKLGEAGHVGPAELVPWRGGHRSYELGPRVGQ